MDATIYALFTMDNNYFDCKPLIEGVDGDYEEVTVKLLDQEYYYPLFDEFYMECVGIIKAPLDFNDLNNIISMCKSSSFDYSEMVVVEALEKIGIKDAYIPTRPQLLI